MCVQVSPCVTDPTEMSFISCLHSQLAIPVTNVIIMNIFEPLSSSDIRKTLGGAHNCETLISSYHFHIMMVYLERTHTHKDVHPLSMWWIIMSSRLTKHDSFFNLISFPEHLLILKFVTVKIPVCRPFVCLSSNAVLQERKRPRKQRGVAFSQGDV